jgi:hypothetical protein
MTKEIFVNSIDFLSNLTVVGNLSAGTFESPDSPKWNSVYSTVQSNSAASWNYQGTDLKDLSANWQNTYTTVNSLSSSWEESADIIPTVTNYLSTSNVLISSLNVKDSLTVFGSISTSGYFLGDGSQLTGIVAGDTEATTLVRTNSADWNIDIDTEVRALTGNYSSVYTTVQLNSAAWAAAAVYIKKYDYVSDGVDFSYSGLAADGTLETDPAWTVTQLVFSDVGALSTSGVAQGITWTERLTATYI